MSGKSLDDYSESERDAYEQGCADTHARYEQMQAQAHAWLTAALNVVAKWERVAEVDAGRPNGALHRQHAREIRDALSVGRLPLKVDEPETGATS